MGIFGDAVFRRIGLAAAILAIPLAHSACAEGILPPMPNHDVFVVNEASVNQAARALGFIIGQRVGLEEVARQYPDLAGEAASRSTAFDVTYNFPEKRTTWFLEHAVGSEATAKQIEAIEEQTRYTSQGLTRNHAEIFLAEMDLRLNGQMDEVALRTFLWLASGKSPDQEMRKWSQLHNTEGHAKAAGLSVSLRLPYSWDHEEGNRPHIVAKWTSQAGSGDMVISLIVRELPPEETITYEDVLAVEQEGDWEWLTPEGFEFLGGKAIVIDRQPGLRADTRGNRMTLDMTVSQQVRNYTIFLPARMVQLSCSLGEVADSFGSEQEARFDNLKSVCDLVASSVTFPQLWK